LIAYAAIERNDGTVSAGAHMIDQRVRVDAFMTSKMRSAVVGRVAMMSLQPPLTGEEGDFVAGLERGVPRCEFLVPGRDSEPR